MISQRRSGEIRLPPDATLDESEYYLKLMTSVLQHAYNSQPPEHPFYWSPDSQTTRMEIMASPPRQLDAVARYPHITVFLGPVSDAMRTIDDMAHVVASDGTKTRVKLRNAYFTFFCIAKGTIEARKLASHLHTMLSACTDILESPGGFHQFGRMPVTENAASSVGTMAPGDPQGLVMVGVNVSASWMWGYRTTPERGLLGDRTLQQIMATPSARELPVPGAPHLHAIHIVTGHSAEYAPSIRGGSEPPRQIVSERRGIADIIIPPLRGE